MKVLLVYAHPESRSLNGALRDFIVSHLRERGHEVKVSDLYAMDWKPTIDAADFLDQDPTERLDVVAASKHAYASGTQAPDIEAEQQKLLWLLANLFKVRSQKCAHRTLINRNKLQ